MRNAIILGKKTFGRQETLEYASRKYNWNDVIIGISCYYGFWAWVLGRLTKRKVIYYCIDFYSPRVQEDFLDGIFIRLSWFMDWFLVRRVDEVWDISTKINEGRSEFGHYRAYFSQIIPLSYPPTYFRSRDPLERKKVAFVGLDPYGIDLFQGIPEIELVWIGKGGGKTLPIEELVDRISECGFGVSLWEIDGNNYYGDPGKTKLYSACGLPVIMTDNTPYAKIIKETMAGIVIKYDKEELKKAIKEMLFNYDFYKRNVKKTWELINADEIFRNHKLLEF